MRISTTASGAMAEEVREDEIVDAIDACLQAARAKFPGKSMHITAQECDTERADQMPDGCVVVKAFARRG